MFAGAARAALLRQKVFPFIAKVTIEDLLVLKELIEAEEVTPVIDRTYALAETSDALGYLETQQVRGKLVVTV
jgi:NADPH:quinone reductase-like Zn-dependent oxidoreductase